MEKTVELLKALVKAITGEESKVIESISEEKMAKSNWQKSEELHKILEIQ